jgi:signal transduction histidine kinase
MAVRAPSLEVPTTPRAVLIATNGEILKRHALAFVPLLVGALSVFILGSLVALFVARQSRLEAEVEREAALRHVIAERERRLRETQERLVASAKLAALSESAAALAHELRNPMGAIVNSAALLRSDGSLDADSEQLLDVLHRESQRLERAIGQFLDLARRPTPVNERVELGALARDVVELAKRDPSFDPSTEWSVELASSEWFVLADPDELRQVLWNLLRNAGAANRRASGRAIGVHVTPEERETKAGLLLEVLDEGPGPPEGGIAPGQAAKARPAQRGAGLGLIVIGGIVAHYSGQFDILARPADAPEGRSGARARVWLPRAESEVEHSPDDAPLTPVSGPSLQAPLEHDTKSD